MASLSIQRIRFEGAAVRLWLTGGAACLEAHDVAAALQTPFDLLAAAYSQITPDAWEKWVEGDGCVWANAHSLHRALGTLPNYLIGINTDAQKILARKMRNWIHLEIYGFEERWSAYRDVDPQQVLRNPSIMRRLLLDYATRMEAMDAMETQNAAYEESAKAALINENERLKALLRKRDYQIDRIRHLLPWSDLDALMGEPDLLDLSDSAD